MTVFFDIKEKVAGFYKSFEAYFQIIFKFLVAYFVFGYINDSLGYYEMLNNAGVQVLLSLISAIVPSSVFVLLAAVVSLLHLYKLSMIMTILAFVAYVVFYFMYLKFAPKHGILMMVIPVLMPLNLHFVVPMIAGLFFSPFTIVPIGCSFIMMKIVGYVVEAAPLVDGAKLDMVAIVAAYQQVIDRVLGDKEMLMYAFAFAVIVVVTYVITRLPFDYSWYVGIIAGAVAGAVAMSVGSSAWGVSTSFGSNAFGLIISCIIVCIIQFFYCTVDYSKKEYVQFEDDDYYYYVKAIPKIGSRKKARAYESNRPKVPEIREDLKEMFSREPEDEYDFNEDFSDYPPSVPDQMAFRPSSVSDKTQIRSSAVPDKTLVSKNMYQKTVVDDKPAVAAAAKSKPVSDTIVNNKPVKKDMNDVIIPNYAPEKQVSYDYDFDEDGYDDSMADYGSNDGDF